MTSAPQKGTSATSRSTAEPTAPSMYMAPWLKLTTPMTPKMTASPRAARA